MLPFNFGRKNNRILMSNDIGEFYFLEGKAFDKFVAMKLEPQSEIFKGLESKFMVCKENLADTIDLMATRYRTKKRFLYDFTSLHMFVVTQRCNQKCTYCHASSVDDTFNKNYDMDIKTARKCVELALTSPSPHIKIEFQGGEPLLNFNTVKEIVEYAKQLNQDKTKIIEFVICTNLTQLDAQKLEYTKQNKICISTSLDGPQDIHDKCRKTRKGYGTYQKVTENMAWASQELGSDNISALMTITPYSLRKLRAVIDEYLEKGLQSIFLRMINPYGRVTSSWQELGYSVEEFILNYQDALKYIIELNLQGVFFPEEFTALLLARILTPFSTGFVDLQSPTGAGISGVIYETNGDVFIADEARMLARMTGEKTFCLGNVNENSWQDMFCGKLLKEIIEDSCIESSPGCAWCVFQPYCGSDPIRNYIQYKDFKGNASRTDFCKKHRAIFNTLFSYLENGSDEIHDVFWSWLTNRNISEVQI